VFAIMAVIFGAPTHPIVGWVCYTLAIVQFLIIGLVSSRDKALDVLREFDQQVKLRRDNLAEPLSGFRRQRRTPSPPMYRGVDAASCRFNIDGRRGCDSRCHAPHSAAQSACREQNCRRRGD
jgi:hypothetical protein